MLIWFCWVLDIKNLTDNLKKEEKKFPSSYLSNKFKLTISEIQEIKILESKQSLEYFQTRIFLLLHWLVEEENLLKVCLLINNSWTAVVKSHSKLGLMHLYLLCLWQEPFSVGNSLVCIWRFDTGFRYLKVLAGFTLSMPFLSFLRWFCSDDDGDHSLPTSPSPHLKAFLFVFVSVWEAVKKNAASIIISVLLSCHLNRFSCLLNAQYFY